MASDAIFLISDSGELRRVPQEAAAIASFESLICSGTQPGYYQNLRHARNTIGRAKGVANHAPDATGLNNSGDFLLVLVMGLLFAFSVFCIMICVLIWRTIFLLAVAAVRAIVPHKRNKASNHFRVTTGF